MASLSLHAGAFLLGLALGFGLTPRSAAQDGPVVGVEDSMAFRWSDAPDLPKIVQLPHADKLPVAKRLAPASFAEQLGEWGLRVIHLPVVDDPEPGAWARPGGARALLQPGLKVANPVRGVDEEALCVTLVLCLRDIDAWSRANPGHPDILIVLDADAPVYEGRFNTLSARFLGKPMTNPPSWERMAREVQAVLRPSRRTNRLTETGGRLMVVARGGGGPAPQNPPFEIAALEGGGVVVAPADRAIRHHITYAVEEGSTVILLGAEGLGRGSSLTLGEAAEIGVDAVVLTPDAVRRTY